MAQPSSMTTKTAKPSSTSVNLVRILARFRQILITPDSETEAQLRVSKSERAKVGANLEYAHQLLSRLEQEAHAITVPNKKHEAHVDLARKRSQLQIYVERLQQLNDLAEYGDDASDDEDSLEILSPTGAPVADIDSNPTGPSSTAPTIQVSAVLTGAREAPSSPIVAEVSTTASVSAPTIRARHQAEKTKLLASSTCMATGASVSASAEILLTHNRTEQENLTTALLEMARTLKSSSHAFNMALEEEKNVLDHATKGLDKNELALEAAQRRMGLLRRMSEGKGWWGRMMMYAWIAGLALTAFLIVFLLPKLRF
ncbi:hypothetical protein K3495_g993 [Podosphaera aphanis]|nr:hypothetical protein K3495_g993 [Podosphaera aphanis]